MTTETEHLFTRLKVSKTHGVKLCRFNKEAVDLYDKHVWSLLKGPKTFYLIRSFVVDKKRKYILFHRELLGLKDGEIYDHINGDGLCNMRSNLRPATLSQNAHNNRLRTDNKHGVKGLCFHEIHQSWLGQIICDGKKYAKESKDQQVVIDWLIVKREELHGTFANHG